MYNTPPPSPPSRRTKSRVQHDAQRPDHSIMHRSPTKPVPVRSRTGGGPSTDSDMIFAMSPSDHYHNPSLPSHPQHPSALFARAKQQSAYAAMGGPPKTRPTSQALYSFPTPGVVNDKSHHRRRESSGRYPPISAGRGEVRMYYDEPNGGYDDDADDDEEPQPTTHKHSSRKHHRHPRTPPLSFDTEYASHEGMTRTNTHDYYNNYPNHPAQSRKSSATTSHQHKSPPPHPLMHRQSEVLRARAHMEATDNQRPTKIVGFQVDDDVDDIDVRLPTKRWR